METTSYDILKGKVEQGKLRVISLDSPARSSCTALLRAISESNNIDGYSYEPFRRPATDFQVIVKHAKEVESMSYESLQKYKDKVKKLLNEKVDMNTYMNLSELWRSLERVTTANNNIAGRDIIKNSSSNSYPDRIISGYDRILALVKKLEKSKEDGEKVTVIVKDLSKNLAVRGNIDTWNQLVSDNVFVVRNPLLQIESLIKAISRDLPKRKEMEDFDFDYFVEEMKKEYKLEYTHEGNEWSNFIETLVRVKDYRPLNDVLDRFLDVTTYGSDFYYDDIAKHLTEDQLKKKKFRREGWDWLLENYKSANNPIIVDATIYRAYPEIEIPNVCSRLQLKFRHDMTCRWINGFVVSHMEGVTHYNTKSGNSIGIHNPNEQCIQLSRLPTLYRSYIEEVAYGSYLTILEQRNLFHDKDTVTNLLEKRVGESVKLYEVDPVFCYSVVITARYIQADIRYKLLQQLRKESKKYEEEFTLIDQLTEND